MADNGKDATFWPIASWAVLKRIVRAWYAAESGGGEWSQRTVARLANVQPSRISANKRFLQTVGIVQSEGIGLTEAGTNLGVGLSNENERVTRQALQKIVRDSAPLKQLLDILRGRGGIDKEGFEAEVLLIARQGADSDRFRTGVAVLQDILVESGLVERAADGALKPMRAPEVEAPPPTSKPKEGAKTHEETAEGYVRIPVPVSATAVWYIQIPQGAEEADINKFIEMQKLIFSRK